MKTDNNCIGCQACVEMCPYHAIDFIYNIWGEGNAHIDETKCRNCGLCENICPSKTISFEESAQKVYALFSKTNRNSGSSGGIFFELGSKFIAQGGIVYGAAFDECLKLVHTKATNQSDLLKLCKSKYLHSDMTGVYTDISNLLKRDFKVMFVGTPCQVSAVKNIFIPKYKDHLLLVDFLCHGTGTQKIFDICVNEEQKKKGGKIVDFTFRAKTRKSEHSFQYVLKSDKKDKIFSGYSFEFPYYHSYLKYNIFNEYCYECNYALNVRVGDVTLGDFWGIQKYNKNLNDQDGVSMISLNTQVGKKYFDQIRSECVVYEYPIKSASDNNQAFRERECMCSRNSKHNLEKVLCNDGETALVERLSSTNIRKQIIYAKTPNFVKTIWNRARGRK